MGEMGKLPRHWAPCVIESHRSRQLLTAKFPIFSTITSSSTRT